jgi:hypothetical protein
MKEKVHPWERELQHMRDVDIDDFDESQLRVVIEDLFGYAEDLCALTRDILAHHRETFTHH